MALSTVNPSIGGSSIPSNIDQTELGYLDNLTENIQNKFNSLPDFDLTGATEGSGLKRNAAGLYVPADFVERAEALTENYLPMANADGALVNSLIQVAASDVIISTPDA